MLTKFHIFSPNFTILTKFHNFDKISQFLPNDADNTDNINNEENADITDNSNNADHADHADHADNVDNAANADNSHNADKAQNLKSFLVMSEIANMNGNFCERESNQAEAQTFNI